MSLARRTVPGKPPEVRAAVDRRQGGRRREDLDSAYNDGTRPTPLGAWRDWALYGGSVWIGITSIVGTIYILASLWTAITHRM